MLPSLSFYSYSDWSLLAMRLVLAVIMISHGWPKIKNLQQNGENFKGMRFHPGIFWGTVVALVEVAGGIGILAGFWTQVFAALFFVNMIVAVIWKLFKWHKPLKDCEFELALIVLSLAILTFGGGAYSVGMSTY